MIKNLLTTNVRMFTVVLLTRNTALRRKKLFFFAAISLYLLLLAVYIAPNVVSLSLRGLVGVQIALLRAIVVILGGTQ